MDKRIRDLIRAVCRPLSRNRYLRILCAYYFYRKWLRPSEAVFALRRKEDVLDETYWMGKLRQYAHIVDKGLHRADFSQGHGTRAYGMAKDALSHIRSPDRLSDPSVQWAVQKIRQYGELQSRQTAAIGSDYVGTCCRYDDLLDVIKARRSIRRYTDKPVRPEVIDKIIDVLDWAPTSCNRQPTRVYATNNPDIVRQCVKLHAGAACFTDIYAPLFVTFCADSRLYAMPTELMMPHIDVALGVQNCVLVAHTLGLSLTLLTWALRTDYQDRQLREVLGIPRHYQIVVSAVGGYPDGGVQVPARKNKELFVLR